MTNENTPPPDPISPADQPAGPPPDAIAPPPPPAPDSPTVVGMPVPPPPPGYTPPPPPGYVAGPPPGYAPPPPGYPPGSPPPVYPGQPYAYGAPPPPPSRRGPSALLLGGIAVILVVLVGLGAMFALKLGPFAPAPTLVASPSLLPTASPTALPTATPSATPTEALTPEPTPSSEPTEEPTATATASTEPTATAGETPSVEPTIGPSAEPTTTIPPTTLPSGDPTQVLLGHIPEEFRADCTTSPGIAPVLALATCSEDDGELLMLYYLYGTREEMNAAYEIYRLGAQIEPDTGSCQDSSTWPAENGYTITQVPVGRYLCQAVALPTIHWTDDRFNILSQVSHALSDYDRLFDFWINEAGPI